MSCWCDHPHHEKLINLQKRILLKQRKKEEYRQRYWKKAALSRSCARVRTKNGQKTKCVFFKKLNILLSLLNEAHKLQYLRYVFLRAIFLWNKSAEHVLKNRALGKPRSSSRFRLPCFGLKYLLSISIPSFSLFRSFVFAPPVCQVPPRYSSRTPSTLSPLSFFESFSVFFSSHHAFTAKNKCRMNNLIKHSFLMF